MIDVCGVVEYTSQKKLLILMIIYAYRQKNLKCLFFCKVFVGQSIELQQDNNLREPPFINEPKKINYDSVKGNADGSEIFILYANDRSYPCYMVE